VSALRLELKRRPPKKKKVKRKLTFFLLFIIMALLFSWCILTPRLSPMLREVAQSELESIAYDIVGRVVEEELSREDISYDDLVNIERDANGKVSAITTNMQKVNLLKLRIANRLSEEMFIRTEDVIKIPFGNLTGIDFLTGVGPDVHFRTMWVSSVDSEFINTFEAAGINQTRHRMELEFLINVGMMFAGREIGVDVGMNVCVAETVIVGEIPKYFSEK